MNWKCRSRSREEEDKREEEVEEDFNNLGRYVERSQSTQNSQDPGMYSYVYVHLAKTS